MAPFEYRMMGCKSHIPFLESSLFLGLCTSGAVLVLVLWGLWRCTRQESTSDSEHSDDSDDSDDSSRRPSGQHGGDVLPLCPASRPQATAEEREGQPKGEQRGSGRSCYVDNCRFVLETLVIMGHTSLFICPRVHDKGYAIWLSVYNHQFHMQMFALTSGLVSKGYLTPLRAKRSVLRVIVPYLLIDLVVFPTLDAWIKGHLYPTKFLHTPLSPFHGLWFLQAWIVWRCIMPFLSTLRLRNMISVAFLISWLAGYWNDSRFFSVHEALAFLGYYVTGYAIPFEWLQLLDRGWVKKLGLMLTLLIVGVNLAISLIDEKLSTCLFTYQFKIPRSFYFKDPKQVLHQEPLAYVLAWTARLCHQFFVCFPTGAALLVIVPHQRTFFTDWGTRTMSAYIFQTPVFTALAHLMDSAGVAITGPIGWLVCVPVLGVAINALLASAPAHKVLRFIMEPDWVLGAFDDDDDLKKLM